MLELEAKRATDEKSNEAGGVSDMLLSSVQRQTGAVARGLSFAAKRRGA